MAFVVPTSYGNIKGTLTKNKDNVSYHAFYKVPFAKPPLGNLRFALPQPPEPWKNVVDCSKKVVCASLQVIIMMPESKTLVGVEDCLYLNVFSPQMPEVGKPLLPPLPVIVYIHGGAFCVGSSDPRLYGPEYFIDKGVVVVNINYRLGPLGFFSLGDDSAPGNQGLHDQVEALKWVQQNIAAFGGDKNNVTIMGESAGAMACFLHLVSPLSKGLFHRIIALSGSATTPFMHNDRDPEIYGRTLSKHLGCKSDDTSESILKHLRSLPAKSFIHNTTLFKDWDVVSPMPWKPVIDTYASKPFLPKSFREVVKEGDYSKNITILAGFTSEEGLIYSAPFHKSSKRWSHFFKEFDHWAPLMFFNRETDLIGPKDVDGVNRIRSQFFPHTVSNDSQSIIPLFDEKNLKHLEEVFTTGIFQAPLIKDLQLLLDQGVKVYTYNFTYAGTMTLMEIFRLPLSKLMVNIFARHLGVKCFQKNLGACHGDDLLYIFPFDIPALPKILQTEADKNVSKWMTQMLSNFAKNGDPNSESQEVKWEQYDGKMFYNFGQTLSCTELKPEVREKITFWNDLVDDTGLLDWKYSNIPIPKLHTKPAEKRNN